MTQPAAPGPDGGPGTPSRPPEEPAGLRGALLRADRLLRLVGSHCCAGRGYAAWERIRDQEPSRSEPEHRNTAEPSPSEPESRNTANPDIAEKTV